MSAVSLHGIAGVVGFLCTTIFSYRNINSAAENGLTYGRGIPLAYHISALLVFIPCVFIATWLALHVSNFIVPIEDVGILMVGKKAKAEFIEEGKGVEVEEE